MKKFESYYQSLIIDSSWEINPKCGRLQINSTDGYKELIPLRGLLPIQRYQEWVAYKAKQVESEQIRESFKGLSIEEVLAHKHYRYARSRNYGITFYGYDPCSGGVQAVGGCDNSELEKVRGCLSPTEGLRRF